MVWRTLPMAAHALLRNKTRSLLTLLGVIIGVASVIAMVAIGEGAKVRVEEEFGRMGTNVIIVGSGTSHAGHVMGGAGSLPTLTWDDLAAIRALPLVSAAAPVAQVTTQLVTSAGNWNTRVYGTSAEYFRIREWPAHTGRALTESDDQAAAKVVVLGQTVVDQLFGPTDPVGEAVRVNNVPFQIVGVLKVKGQSPWGRDYDDAVFIPMRSFRMLVQGGMAQFIPGRIDVSAVDPNATMVAQTAIANLLRDRHGIQPGDEDDFHLRNLIEQAEARQQGMKTLSNLLAAIAAVSLLVGGIGIMNIMLVSVTERTREIGLRMAVGAKPRDILAQFLVEAFTLSTVGGLIGVALGVGTAFWLSAQFDWKMIIRPDIVAMALGFSALVGIFFGLYPAYKASRLDPIEALRFE